MKEPRTGWYLILTKPRQENIARINLEQQGFNLYLPLIQEYKRRNKVYQLIIEPMFPSYLFIYLNSRIDDWSKIRSTRGCISLVRFGMLPACVPESLVNSLKQYEVKQFEAPKTKTSLFKTGDKVRILDGVLANYEGIVRERNGQERISLLLTLSEGHTRTITLPVHQVALAVH